MTSALLQKVPAKSSFSTMKASATTVWTSHETLIFAWRMRVEAMRAALVEGPQTGCFLLEGKSEKGVAS
jgi:hypothetical protein